MKRIIILILALFLLTATAYAQDADPGDTAPAATIEALASEAAPVAPDTLPEVEAPAPVADQTVNVLVAALFGLAIFSGILLLIIAYLVKVMTDAGLKSAINVAEIVREVGKLYPADALDKLIERERLKAAGTDTPIDDIVTAVADSVLAKVKAIVQPEAITAG